MAQGKHKDAQNWNLPSARIKRQYIQNHPLNARHQTEGSRGLQIAHEVL